MSDVQRNRGTCTGRRWLPADKTVFADEQRVQDSISERGDAVLFFILWESSRRATISHKIKTIMHTRCDKTDNSDTI